MSRSTPFSVTEYALFVLFILLLGWLGPTLEKRGHPVEAIVLKLIGGFGAVFCVIFSLRN